jgi:mono/diheme cytochrome c family protein
MSSRAFAVACGLAAALGWSVALSGIAVADPRVDYMLNCRGCHGPDGAGAPGAAPSFRGQLARFLWVPGGREYLVRVPGTAQSELDDARTAALLNWLLHEFSAAEIPPDFAPYGPEEVASLRRAPLADVWRTRNELLRVLATQADGPPAARAQ